MISFLAPILSVVFGVAIVLLYSKSKPLNLKLFLAFSGAFLLSTTIFELLPEVYQNCRHQTNRRIYYGWYFAANSFRVLLQRCRTWPLASQRF